GHASTHELPQVLSDGGSVHEAGGRRSDAAAASTLAVIGARAGAAVLTAAAVAVGGDGAVVASHLGGLLSWGRGRHSGRTAGLDPAETAGGAEGLPIRAAAVVGFGVVAAGAGDERVVVAAGCGLEATTAAFSDELVFVEPSPDAVGLGVGEGVGEALGAHGAGGADAFRCLFAGIAGVDALAFPAKPQVGVVASTGGFGVP